MSTSYPGWMTLAETARYLRISHADAYTLAASGAFSFGNLTGEPDAPVALRTVELDAYRKGGIVAVLPLKAAFARAERELAETATPVGA